MKQFVNGVKNTAQYIVNR